MSHYCDPSSRAVTWLGIRNTANENFNHLTAASDFEQFFSWLRGAIPENIWVPEDPIELFFAVLLLSMVFPVTFGVAMMFDSKRGRIVAATIAAVEFAPVIMWLNTIVFETGGLRSIRRLEQHRYCASAAVNILHQQQ